MKRLLPVLCVVAGAAAAQPIPASDDEIHAFVRADGNADGVLTPVEFRVFVQAMARAGQPTAQQIRFFGAYGYAFGVVDRNRDGVATPEELRRGDDAHRAGD